MKKKLSTILLAILIIVLAGVAVFTAFRLYNLRQQAVAPNAPESEPEAATINSCQDLTFSISIRPSLCKNTTASKTTLKPGESTTITSTAKESANNFTYAFYNNDNLYGPNNPKPVCVTTGGDSTYVGDCPAGTHHLIFKDPNTNLRTSGSRTLKYEDIFVADANNDNKVVTSVHILGYFSITDGQTSLPEAACVVDITAGTAPTATATATSAPTSAPTATATAAPTSAPTTAPSPTPNGCGGTCGSNSNCGTGLYCYNGYCRNPSCPAETDCTCESQTPQPTTVATLSPTNIPTQAPQASLPNAGVATPTLLGIGIGAVLLIISIALAI
jgi:hypothetical protein